MTPASGLPALLELEPVGPHRYAGRPEHAGDRRNVVFGGQILAQMIMAAQLDRRADGAGDQEVKSIHAVFARAGDYTAPIEYEVEAMHRGRTLGSDTVTFRQHGEVMSRGVILWSRPEPDLIRHTSLVMPDVAPPDDPAGRPDGRVFPGAVGLIVDGIDTWSDDEPVRDPVQNVWTRFDLASDDQVAHQAVLSWATDGYLIGTAMLPHAGFHEGQAHRTISTGVVSHTLNFHEPFDVSEWLLLAHESIWAGRGRAHGRADVWTRDGRLVATFTQDSLVRAFADRRDHTADYQRIM